MGNSESVQEEYLSLTHFGKMAANDLYRIRQ